MAEKLIIFGDGEIATLAHFYFSNDSKYEVVGFCVDQKFKNKNFLNGLPIFSLEEIEYKFNKNEVDLHIAISYSRLNKNREIKYNQIKNMGYKLASYVSSKSCTWNDLEYGDNCFILEGQTLQPTIKIGNNVMIWSGNHIGHNSIIEDHVYISSHVVISGNCKIGSRSFLGVNCTIKDFTNIGRDCFITMGALVKNDLEDCSTIISQNSKILLKDDPINYKIRKKYFNL